MPPQITTPEMEIAKANHFGFRKNLNPRSSLVLS